MAQALQLVSDRTRTHATIAVVSSSVKKDGDTIITQGYTAASDGGGNVYEYHSTGKSLVTVDGGFYVSLGAGDDYLEASDKSVVNIRKFGCNGTTDLAQFTLAVTTAMTLSVPVYVPPGNYDLSELTVAINLTTSLSMYGDGSQSILTGPNTTTTLFEVVNTSGASLHCNDVSFSTFFNVFNLQGNTGQPTYEVDFYGLHCNNLGAGLLGSGGGVYCLFSTVRMDNIEITNAGLDLTTAVPFAINIAVKAADAVILNSVYCDTIGSLSNTKPCIGILVDCTDSTDKLQPVVITDCVVKNVKSNTSTGTDQVVGIMMLECAGIIDSCTVDSIEAPSHTSSPEGIYCKGKKFIVNACRIIDVIGSEAVINIKGGPDVPQASIGSIISNNYIGFTAQPSGNAKGIDLNLPDVHCHHNTIEDCSTGIVASMDGTLIEANVIRRAYSNTAIDIQVPYGGNPRIRVINNEFQDCGNATDANVYACLAVVASAETMNLLEFSGNRITGMNALTTRWGFRVTHTSSGSISHLVLNRNQMFDVQVGLNINASTNAITTCEIHDNIITGPVSEANAVNPTATFTTLSVRGNLLDGVPLSTNDDTSSTTTAELASISATINTRGKYIGKAVFNTTTSKPVYAAGASAASVWVDATGATAHTPV